MDIINDTNTLITNRNLLKQKKDQFGDVNLKMIKMISTAKQSLEGNQMDLAQRTTFESIGQIKNLMSAIDENIRYLDELTYALVDYFKCKFREV